MTPSLDRWTRGWRGPLLAALIALAAALPGALLLPATDRSEARLAEASAQMLEDRDFTATAVDDQAPDRRPLGVHWLQAAAVGLASDPEARQIWAYRLPALAGAMIAAAACAWGGAALFGSGTGFVAGALLGASMLVSTAAVIDAPGVLLGAGVTLAMAAFARLRLAAESAFKAGRPTRLLFWLGLALSAVAGGPVGPAVVILSAAALWLVERRAPWFGRLGWTSGLILMAGLVGPSVVAAAVNGGLGTPSPWPQSGAGERAPGFQLLVSPLMLFPFALALPAGLAALGRARREPALRLTLCWLIPAWLVLEFARGRPAAGGLVVYGALAWLCAYAVSQGVGRLAARLGAAIQLLAAAVLIAGLVYLAQRFGGGAALAWAIAACSLIAAAAFGGGALMLRGQTGTALIAAGVLGLMAHGVVLAGMAPRLDSLWVAKQAAIQLGATGLDPRAGVMPGPVAVSGFGEPSLTFALGGQTEQLSPEDAAAAIKAGRPAIVEARQEDAFLAALPSKASVRRAGAVEGFNYANGTTVRLELFGPAAPSR